MGVSGCESTEDRLRGVSIPFGAGADISEASSSMITSSILMTIGSTISGVVPSKSPHMDSKALANDLFFSPRIAEAKQAAATIEGGVSNRFRSEKKRKILLKPKQRIIC